MWRSLVLKINLKIGLTFITIQNSDFSQTLIPTLFINFSKFKKMGKPRFIKYNIIVQIQFSDLYIHLILTPYFLCFTRREVKFITAFR